MGWKAEQAFTCLIHIFPDHFGPSTLDLVRRPFHTSSAPQKLEFLETRVSTGAWETFVRVNLWGHVGSRTSVGLVSGNVWGWGAGGGAAPSQARPAFPPSAASPQREPPWEEGLPSKELADEEGNVPGNGRQMFKFQRGRVEFERKPLTYVYDFMYRRKKCYLTHSWPRGERKWGNCEGQGHSSVLAAEKRRQLACVGSLTVPEAHVLLGH